MFVSPAPAIIAAMMMVNAINGENSYANDDPSDYGFGDDDFDPDEEEGYRADTPDYDDIEDDE